MWLKIKCKNLKTDIIIFYKTSVLKHNPLFWNYVALLKYWRVNIYSYTSDDNESWYIDFANTHTVGKGREQGTYNKIVKIEVPGLSNTKCEVFLSSISPLNIS